MSELVRCLESLRGSPEVTLPGCRRLVGTVPEVVPVVVDRKGEGQVTDVHPTVLSPVPSDVSTPVITDFVVSPGRGGVLGGRTGSERSGRHNPRLPVETVRNTSRVVLTGSRSTRRKACKSTPVTSYSSPPYTDDTRGTCVPGVGLLGWVRWAAGRVEVVKFMKKFL